MAKKSKQKQIDDKNAKVIGTVSLILFFLGSIFERILVHILPVDYHIFTYGLSRMLFFASIILIVNGRIKYPDNKFLKTVMWIMIIAFLILLVLFLIFLAMCISADTSSCG